MFEEITGFPPQDTFNEEDMTAQEDECNEICNANNKTNCRE